MLTSEQLIDIAVNTAIALGAATQGATADELKKEAMENFAEEPEILDVFMKIATAVWDDGYKAGAANVNPQQG